METTSGPRRAANGCGAAFVFATLTGAITVGGVFAHQWLDPTYAGRDVGQGEGILGALFLVATPFVGGIAAWRLVGGVALGVLVLGALIALHVWAMMA